MSVRPETGGPPTRTASRGPDGEDPHVVLQNSDDFRRLRRDFRLFVFPVAAAFCLWYLMYVLFAVYARDFMGKVLFGDINVGFVFGVLQFVTTFLIAWLYARYARTRLDPTAEAVRGQR